MKNGLLSVAVFSLACGCSAPDVGGGDPKTLPAAPTEEVGKTEQRSQFADGTVFNIVDPGAAAWMTLLADGDPVTVQIYYIGDKTTDTGRTPSQAVLVDTISLDSDDVRSHLINLNHPAFAGGYGCILADAIGVSPTTVFQTYLTMSPANVTQSVGGSVFQGTSFRIPVFRGASKVVLALTNQSDFEYEVLLAQIGGIASHRITIPPLSTYKFDSSQHGFTWPAANASKPDALQIFTQASGTVAVNGYIQVGAVRYRVAPVKAAAYL